MGDYGKLDKQTGEFKKRGNIYNDTDIYEDQNIAELVKEHPSKAAPREDVYIAASSKVTRSELKLGVDM